MDRRRMIAALPLVMAAPFGLAQDAPASAPAAARRYVVMSFLSDQLSFVEKVGGTSDPTQNRPKVLEVPLPGAPYDKAALQAIASALPAAEAGARMSFLAASAPEFYADQEDWFDGDRAKLPDKLRRAVAGEQADFLLLLTKWRGEAEVSDGKVVVGTGTKIEGLGVYRFARREGESRDATEVHGYLAPFVYARLSLIDLAGWRVVRSKVIQAATSYPALSPQEQLDALGRMLDAGARDAVPAVVRGG